MAKRVRDSGLESRAARQRLKARGKPYYKAIGQGLHLGYRKGIAEGKWVVRRYTGNQSYVVETIATADDIEDADGERILNFWQAQDRARERGGQLVYSGPYRVRDAMEAYITYLGPDRSHAAELRIAKHILPTLGDQLVQELTADQLREWLRSMIRVGDEEAARKSQVSANRVLTILKAALNHAFKEGKVSADQAWRRVKPFKGVARSRSGYLTLAECDRLLNVCEPGFRSLVRGALETGARYGELTRMVCGDFNPDSGTIHVKKSKTGKERHIILTEAGAEFFASLTVGRPAAAPMFGEWRADWQMIPMKEACANARIEPRICFHQLRHTWASHAVMGGIPLMIVARNLGHVDTRQVERTYGHLENTYVVQAIRERGPKFGKIEGNVKAIR